MPSSAMEKSWEGNVDYDFREILGSVHQVRVGV